MLVSIIFLVIGVILSITSIFIGSISRIEKKDSIRARIRNSPNLELLLHEVTILFLAIGFVIYIDEYGGMFWQNAFPLYRRLIPFFFAAFFIFAMNIYRHGRFGITTPSTINRCCMDLETDVENESNPEKGIDKTIAKIKRSPESYPDSMVEHFLYFLSQRNDQIGVIAKSRLNNLLAE